MKKLTNEQKTILGQIRAYCDACTDGKSGTFDDSPSIFSALVNVVDSAELHSSGTQAERELEIARFLVAHRNDIVPQSWKIRLLKPAKKKTPEKIAQIFADCLAVGERFRAYETNSDCFQIDSLNNHFLNCDLFACGASDEITISTRYGTDAETLAFFVRYVTNRFSNLFELETA
mgnify:CR=1 FL=1